MSEFGMQQATIISDDEAKEFHAFGSRNASQSRSVGLRH
jgi:hypothetical protein